MKKIILVLAFAHYLSLQAQGFREWLFMSQNQHLILNRISQETEK
jgi:hypothetical protein